MLGHVTPTTSINSGLLKNIANNVETALLEFQLKIKRLAFEANSRLKKITCTPCVWLHTWIANYQNGQKPHILLIVKNEKV